jgi:hypothetical protein
MFTCPSQFGGWFLKEWGFLPVVRARLVMGSLLGQILLGRILWRALPKISSRSLWLKVWQFLFSKLSSSFLQKHLLPLHTHSHLGRNPTH